MNDSQTLISAVAKNEFPRDYACLKTFMFDRCRTQAELKMLLEFYSSLVNKNDKFDEKELRKAVDEKRLVDYLLRVSKNTRDLETVWFRLNLERWLFGGGG